MTRQHAIVLALLVLAGCGSSSDVRVGDVDVGTLAPDFALTDVNTGSPSGTLTVTPRDYLSKVSAWYFGHAT